jgi:hypothetical protein
MPFVLWLGTAQTVRAVRIRQTPCLFLKPPGELSQTRLRGAKQQRKETRQFAGLIYSELCSQWPALIMPLILFSIHESGSSDTAKESPEA